MVLTHEFPPVGGGGGQVIQDLCRGLAQRGHELHVLTTHLPGLLKEDKVDGVKVSRLYCGRRVPYRARFIEMALFVLQGIWRGYWLVKSWQPDLIHVHFAVPAGAIGLALSTLTGKPYLLTAHGGDVPGGAPEKTARWFRWVYPLTPFIWQRAKVVVAVSEQTLQLAEKHYPVKIIVIHNGFDFKALNLGKVIIGTPPRIIWAGRFMPEKNPLKVVQTLIQLKDLAWHCVMIGDGPLKNQVDLMIKRAGMEDRFWLPGWMTQAEVMGWFAQSDVLFMPSLSEGLPIVGLQGLAMGLAIVATRVGGFVELVEHQQNGYLVDNADNNGFVEPLKRLLSDLEKLKTFREQSHKIKQRFDVRFMIQEYEELMLQMVKKQ